MFVPSSVMLHTCRLYNWRAYLWSWYAYLAGPLARPKYPCNAVPTRKKVVADSSRQLTNIPV